MKPQSDVMTDLQHVVDFARALPPRLGGLDPAARRAALTALDQTARALTAARSTLLVAERETAEWRHSGYPSVEAWRGKSAGVGTREAREEVALADTLGAAPAVRDALTGGTLSVEHAEVLTRLRRKAPELCDADLNRSGGAGEAVSGGGAGVGGGSELMELALREDAGVFARSADRWLAANDPARHDREHEAIRRSRFLHISESPSGTRLRGLLDPIAGHTLQLALEAATARPGPNDDRDFGQRNADALQSLAEISLDAGELKYGAVVRPHVSLVLGEDTWHGAQAELARRAAAAEPGVGGGAGTGSRSVPEAGEASGTAGRDEQPEFFPPATLEDGTPVPLTELSRLLCDCEITRVALSSAGTPVNLGRTTRVFSREQRRAVMARDRHCRFPDCERPARWCQVHHIRWWQRDSGPTSVDNAILLCSFHHHEVHRLDLDCDSWVGTATMNRPGRSERRATGRGRVAACESSDGRSSITVVIRHDDDDHAQDASRRRPRSTAGDIDPGGLVAPGGLIVPGGLVGPGRLVSPGGLVGPGGLVVPGGLVGSGGRTGPGRRAGNDNPDDAHAARRSAGRRRVTGSVPGRGARGPPIQRKHGYPEPKGAEAHRRTDHEGTVTQSRSRAVTQPRSHAAAQPRSRAVTQSRSHAVTQSRSEITR